MWKVWRCHLAQSSTGACLWTWEVGGKGQTCVTRVNYSECVGCDQLQCLSARPPMSQDRGRYPASVWGWTKAPHLGESAVSHRSHPDTLVNAKTTFGTLRVRVKTRRNSCMFQLLICFCCEYFPMTNQRKMTHFTVRSHSSYHESFQRFTKRYKSNHFKRRHP